MRTKKLAGKKGQSMIYLMLVLVATIAVFSFMSPILLNFVNIGINNTAGSEWGGTLSMMFKFMAPFLALMIFIVIAGTFIGRR